MLAVVLLALACNPSSPAQRSESAVSPAAPTAPRVAAAAAAAPPAPLRLVLNWTAPAGSQASLWVAYDAGLYREQGLDVELVNVPGTARAIQSMAAGEIHLSPLDPATAVQASLGGADIVLLLGNLNRFPFTVVSQPSIQEPQALRGKSLGITRVGASTYTAALFALQGWGLVPDRDVALRSLGETAAIIAGLEAGQIDAGVMQVPVPRSVKANYYELIDLATDGPEYASVAIGGPRAWIQASEEAVRRFVRGYVLGDARARGDKPAAIAAFRKYMKLDDPDELDATYAAYLAMVPRVPYVSEVGLARVLTDLAAEDPRFAGHPPGEFVDSRYVRELEASGAIR
jgi:NitT/TauT family transport system substrate-binding protein